MNSKTTISFLTMAIFFLWATFSFTSCNCSEKTKPTSPYFTYPAVPAPNTPPSTALLYIANTDQKDRLSLTEKDLMDMLKHASPKMDSISVRDSLRYLLLWDLHIRGLVQSPADKYHAGVVFTHGGGGGIGVDTICDQLAIKYFKEAIAEGDAAIRDSALFFLPFPQYRFEPKDSGKGFGLRIEKDPVHQ
jgi:hypothetical protein